MKCPVGTRVPSPAVPAPRCSSSRAAPTSSPLSLSLQNPLSGQPAAQPGEGGGGRRRRAGTPGRGPARCPLGFVFLSLSFFVAHSAYSELHFPEGTLRSSPAKPRPHCPALRLVALKGAAAGLSALAPTPPCFPAQRPTPLLGSPVSSRSPAEVAPARGRTAWTDVLCVRHGGGGGGC